MKKEDKEKQQLEIETAMQNFTGEIQKITANYADGGTGLYVRFGSRFYTKAKTPIIVKNTNPKSKYNARVYTKKQIKKCKFQNKILYQQYLARIKDEKS